MAENIDLGDASKFRGYTPDAPAGCYDKSALILSLYGVSPAGDKTKVFKLMYEDGGKYHYYGKNPKENYANAIKCIDRHLEAGRPIIVGVSHTIGRNINEGATDHFIPIYGREFVDGYWYYMYYEVGKSKTVAGYDGANNRFKYDPDGPNGPLFYDIKSKIHGNARFDVTQVRPNDGDYTGTVSQYDTNGNNTNLAEYEYVNPNNSDGVAESNNIGGGEGESGGGSYNNSGSVSGLGSSNSSNSSDESERNVAGFESYDSIGVDKIFGTIFPDDDNNRYINMSAEDITVIQYTEPVLKIEELSLTEKYNATIGLNPVKISYYIPVVYINEFLIPQTNITNFCLDYSSFAPNVMVEFVDMTNDMLSINIPKPGSYIKVFIGGYGDEKYYKPIRQDFVITNISKSNKSGGYYQNHGNPIKYKITGILNVPLALRKMPWSSSKINARQAMFNISNTVGLGFATNFNTNSNTDVMRWINVQNKSYYDFMKEITRHSCYSPYTFFTSFIDQYYVLNYVECRRLLSHGGKKEDSPQMIYSSVMPELDEDGKIKADENLERGDQKVSYYFLSNAEEFKGWTNYIEEFFELNDGQSVVSDGYRKTLTYSDKCGFPDLTSKNYKFILTPIDNLQRDSDKIIMPLPDKVTYDTYIPLNLRQTTNSAYVDSQSVYDNPTVAESTIDLGEVDTSNNFPLYFYASAQNDFQMKNFKKCGLSVRLQNYNPAITRYSRIWVDIYDMHYNSISKIRKNDSVDDMPDSKIKDMFKKKNDNLILYREDTKLDTKRQKYNRSLSGWYVVTEMKISYNTVKDFKGVTYKKLQTQLTLNRVEYKPTFHTEYNMAKKAIEKYKGENLPGDIMRGADSL
jgi:hypothetical protein